MDGSGGTAMPNQKALENIRIRNFSEILEVMRRLGPCSLSQITEQMNVGLTTVKKCVEEGIQDGMILPGETADSTGGRKAQQYRINPAYQYYLMIVTDDNDFIIKVYDSAAAVSKRRDRFFPCPGIIRACAKLLIHIWSVTRWGLFAFPSPA